MKAAIYARVSTLDQSAQMQLVELREYLARRNWEPAGEYVDSGASGAKDRRPELDRLMDAARRRQLDAVVVWRYDRFARSVRHLVNTLAELDALGVQFVSLREGVDTSTPNGRLVFHIFASIAEFERELIRQRVRAGIAHAKSHGTRTGKPIGRPRRIFDRGRVAGLRAAGLSWPRIAAQLGVGVGTAVRALQ